MTLTSNQAAIIASIISPIILGIIYYLKTIVNWFIIKFTIKKIKKP